jgi:hypothetical protein
VDLAWLAPPVIVLLGAAGAADAAAGHRPRLEDVEAARRRVRRLDDALIPLRVETRRARESLDRFDRR